MALPTMEQWLTTIQNDHRSIPQRVKVIEDKPDGAVDACWINGLEVTNAATCNATYPSFADPRITAGAPLADNYIKCELTPLDRRAYPAGTFTNAEWAALQQAFPTGVCNFRKPPVGFQRSIPWLTYQNGSGGQPLGPPPVSRRVS
jgi:hypothetical protein